MRPFIQFLTLCSRSLVAACDRDAAPTAPTRGGPAMWQVERGALKGWLFGTIHVLPNGVAWQTPAMTLAMAQSDQLVLEAAGLQDEQKTLALFEKIGRTPGLPPVEERVPPKDKAALTQAISDAGTSSQLLSDYKSWAAAMILSAASQQALHVSQDNGVEPALIAIFTKAKKPIGGLETVERQFGAFDGLPPAAQARLLIQTVHETKDLKALYDRILKAWVKGDLEAIAKEDECGEQPDPEVEDAIIVVRNRGWVKAIEPMKGKPFIAVGAGHLTGRGNLIDMLKARGFRVTRLQ